MATSNIVVERNSNIPNKSFKTGNLKWDARTGRAHSWGGVVASPCLLVFEGRATMGIDPSMEKCFGIFEAFRYRANNLRSLLSIYRATIRPVSGSFEAVSSVDDVLNWLSKYADEAGIDVIIQVYDSEDHSHDTWVAVNFHGPRFEDGAEIDPSVNPNQYDELNYYTKYLYMCWGAPAVLVHILLFCSQHRTDFEKAYDPWARITSQCCSAPATRFGSLVVGKNDQIPGASRVFSVPLSVTMEMDTSFSCQHGLDLYWAVALAGVYKYLPKLCHPDDYYSVCGNEDLLPDWLGTQWSSKRDALFMQLEKPYLQISPAKILQLYEQWYEEGKNGKLEPLCTKLDTLSLREGRNDEFNLSHHSLSDHVAEHLPVYPAIRLLESTAGPTFERSGVVGIEASMFRPETGEPAFDDTGQDVPETELESELKTV